MMALHSGWLYVAGDGKKWNVAITESDFDIS